MISYAQNLEDVLLNRVFKDVPAGFYVDVGANDPSFFSVTKHFYDSGWRGINIEPGLIFEKLREARPRDVNLNVAATNHLGTVTFYEYPAATERSTVCPTVTETVEHPEGRFTRTVPARPLGAIFDEHRPPPIEFMSIDVEGHEREVLLGNDWARYRPRVVMVEATLPGTPVLCHERWEDVLLAADYLFVYFDGLNRYYVRREDEALRERFSPPPNLFDDYSPAEVVRLNGIIEHINRYAQHNDELLRQADAYAKESDQERLRLREELWRVEGVVRAMDVLSKQTEADRALLRGEARRLNQALDQLDRVARHSHLERLHLEDEVESLRASVKAAEADRRRLQDELQQVRAVVGDLQGSAADAGAWQDRLRAELDNLRGRVRELTRGTGPRSLRFGMRLARGCHWLARRLRLAPATMADKPSPP